MSNINNELYLSDDDYDNYYENENVPPDCLVLKIEEHSYINGIDMTLYILYDNKKKHYVIRGQRAVTQKHNSCHFSFNCNCEKKLMNFINFVVDPAVDRNIVLYNYDNLPYNSNDITYDFLKHYDHPNYELSAYGNITNDEIDLFTTLRMLKYVCNPY
jgi:hypothetical protein